MLSNDAFIVNDLAERLKKFLGVPDLEFRVDNDRGDSIMIISDSDDVEAFLSDTAHPFISDESLEHFYQLPFGWDIIRIRGVNLKVARATAVMDDRGEVRLIIMFDQNNKPAPVELVG